MKMYLSISNVVILVLTSLQFILALASHRFSY